MNDKTIMKEGLNKEFQITPEQKNVEWNNKRETQEHFASEFSRILKENPMEIYVKHGDTAASKLGITFDSVKSALTDESGSGGSISVEFDGSNYVGVGLKGFSGSTYFNKGNDYYKINEASFQNILTMMDELIKRSGYSETEKQAMFQAVVDGLKDKVIKEESVQQTKNKEDDIKEIQTEEEGEKAVQMLKDSIGEAMGIKNNS